MSYNPKIFLSRILKIPIYMPLNSLYGLFFTAKAQGQKVYNGILNFKIQDQFQNS
jgi:uncharacterized membrane protein YqhA